LVSAGVFALAGQAFAQESSADFSNRWLVTPLHSVEGPGGLYQARILERYVMAGDVVFSVGNITYFKVPKSQDVDVGQVAEKLRVAMGFKKWNTRRQKNAHVFETQYTKMRRFFRLYVVDDGKSIAYSVAMFRLSYADLVMLETELIQRKLAGALDQPEAWMDRLISWIGNNLGVAAAYAQGMPPCPTCAAGDTACMMAASTCAQNQINGHMTTLNGQVGQYSPEAIAAWEESNKQIARSNDMLAKFLTPQNAFMFAAATAVGAGVGALVISTVIQGMSTMVENIVESFTHEKEEAALLAAFQKGRETWEKAVNAATTLEATIDDLLYLKKLSKQFNIPREGLLVKLGAAKAEGDSRLRRTNLLLDAAVAAGDQACVRKYSAESAELTEFVDEMTRLRDKLRSPATDAALCIELKQSLSKLALAEGALQNARTDILAGENVWKDAREKRIQKSAENLKRARDEAEGTRDKDLKRAETEWKRVQEEARTVRFAFLEKCRKEKVGLIGEIPIIGGVRFFTTAECNKKFEQTDTYRQSLSRYNEGKQAYEGSKLEARKNHSHAVMRADDLYLSSGVNENELKATNAFFKQIRDEQSCLSRSGACPPGTNGLVSRFRALQAKGKSIDEVCKTSVLGPPQKKPDPSRVPAVGDK
jgi:hypothetical protein